MRKNPVGILIGALVAWGCQASDLTPMEQRWLQGTWPVLIYARDAGLPLDIVVQPQPAPGLPPIALAFVGGRCKFVFSMRDNPEVAATIERVEPELLDAALELMAAHELGHCHRHVGGAWRSLPASHAGQRAVPSSAAAIADDDDRQAVRREEAYGDLVGLAWTQAHHATLYTRLQAWLVAERSLGRVAGGHHDTLAWLRLAGRPQALAGPDPYAAADGLWTAGLDAAP